MVAFNVKRKSSFVDRKKSKPRVTCQHCKAEGYTIELCKKVIKGKRGASANSFTFSNSPSLARDTDSSKFATPFYHFTDVSMAAEKLQQSEGIDQQMVQDVCMEVTRLMKARGSLNKGQVKEAMAGNVHFASTILLVVLML